ncbi:taste receptor type 2 member 60 [Echinops telfairi]|uniref:Taste receptor type 2 n=1 Tax=Echinops telfairi TaxID=9371 RepID=A0ABM0J3K5_ECHTE|nr:taste receptor type 2 member 60 [Echinops telfairi]
MASALAGVLLLLCLGSVVGNGFIIVSLATEWLLRRKLSPCDTLLASLGASRFCLQWVVIGKCVYLFLCPQAFPYNPAMQVFSFLWDFLNSVTLWLSTWLSIFYCVKITTFAHPAFLWLKGKVSRCVPWMLLSSLGLSCFSSILFFIGNRRLYQNYLQRDRPRWNDTYSELRRFYENFYFFPLKLAIWTVPTATFLLGMALLITSLGRHARQVLLIISGSQDTRVQAHFRALLTLISFTILFTTHFLSLVLSSAVVFSFQDLRYGVWQVVLYVCTVLYPVILLWSNPRLRAGLPGRCCLPGVAAS